MKDTISIAGIEVWCHIGVPDEERTDLQRLLISLELEKDFLSAAQTDEIMKTIEIKAIRKIS